MPYDLDQRLVIGVAPSALFDLSESHEVFLRGLQEYRRFQDENVEVPLPRGVAFPFIERLLALNDLAPDDRLVEAFVLAKDDATTGVRVMKSIEHYGLAISRAVFTEGASPYAYIPALNISLFLSGSQADVVAATALGFPAGQVLGKTAVEPGDEEEVPGALRVAFDFDGVLADDSAEAVYLVSGIDEYRASEREQRSVPLSPGPLWKFGAGLARIQRAELERQKVDPTYAPRVRVSIVTARDAPAHERAVYTLRQWGLKVDDAFFLGGVDKARVLRVLRPHIYFDDQRGHLAGSEGVVACVHVPYGVANRDHVEVAQ